MIWRGISRHHCPLRSFMQPHAVCEDYRGLFRTSNSLGEVTAFKCSSSTPTIDAKIFTTAFSRMIHVRLSLYRGTIQSIVVYNYSNTRIPKRPVVVQCGTSEPVQRPLKMKNDRCAEGYYRICIFLAQKNVETPQQPKDHFQMVAACFEGREHIHLDVDLVVDFRKSHGRPSKCSPRPTTTIIWNLSPWEYVLVWYAAIKSNISLKNGR